MYKFFDSINSLTDYLKKSNMLYNFSEQELNYLIFPNVFCIREKNIIHEVPREEIAKLNQYCEDMWK